MITDQAGNVCYDADYFPWGGEQHIYVNGCPQNYKFSGKERDPDMGSDYFGARFYKGTMARFYSPDWSATVEPVPYAKLDNPQSLNLYTYVLNNPLRYTDADGHDEEASGQSTAATSGGQGAPGGPAPNKPLPLNGAPPAPDPAHVHTDPAPASTPQPTTCSTNCHLSTSVQHGVTQVDSDGKVSLVLLPAVAVSGTLNVNGAKSDQTLLVTPTVGLGRFLAVGTDIVKDSDGSIHDQGRSLSLGLSWPPWPANAAVPIERVTPSSGEGIDPTASWNLPSPL